MAVRMDLSHTDIVLKQKKLSITKSGYIIFNVIDFCYISGFFKYKIPNKFIPCDFVAYFNTFSNLFRPGPNSWLPAVILDRRRQQHLMDVGMVKQNVTDSMSCPIFALL